MTPRAERRLIALLVLVALVTGVALAGGCTSKLTRGWPAGLKVLPGTAEAAAAAFLKALASGDTEKAAGMFTARYGLDPADMANRLSAGLTPAGELEAWRIVSRQDGDPVRIGVYTHFSKAGQMVMTMEVYQEAGGWRVGNFAGGPPPGSSPAGASNLKPTTWLTAKTAKLNIHVWPGHEDDLKALVEHGDEAFAMALRPLEGGDRAALSAAEQTAVDVYVYDSLDSLRAAVSPNGPDWTIGLISGGAVHLVSPSGVTYRKVDLVQVCVHELNHELFGRYLGAKVEHGRRLPAWLSEGTAELAAGQLTKEIRADLATRYKAATDLPTLADLEPDFASNPLQDCYALSAALAEYLTKQYGPDALVKLADTIAEGASFREAVEGLTGLTLDGFTNKWHDWVRNGLK